MWACLVAAAVTLLATVAKSPVMLGIGWVGMVVAGVYAARYCPDAKRMHNALKRQEQPHEISSLAAQLGYVAPLGEKIVESD